MKMQKNDFSLRFNRVLSIKIKNQLFQVIATALELQQHISHQKIEVRYSSFSMFVFLRVFASAAFAENISNFEVTSILSEMCSRSGMEWVQSHL